MSLNSLTIMHAIDNSDFRLRVQYFLMKAAVAVIAESEETENHAERAAFAETVLQGAASIHLATLATATNGTVAAALVQEGGHTNVSDSDLEFTVNSIYNTLAGLPPQPTQS